VGAGLFFISPPGPPPCFSPSCPESGQDKEMPPLFKCCFAERYHVQSLQEGTADRNGTLQQLRELRA
jgi:hypothetical protein